jgi:small subunit ribosomal protein S6
VRDYEVTVILQPQLEEAARNELVEDITTRLTHGESEGDKPVVNHWGPRKLAYEINDFSEGYYLFVEAKLDPTQIPELERAFQYTEDIIRYMVIRKPEK